MTLFFAGLVCGVVLMVVGLSLLALLPDPEPPHRCVECGPDKFPGTSTTTWR